MKLQEKDVIDVDFDFTTDTSDFWTNFWDNDPYLGCMGNDPDACSKTLKRYHQLLWSKTLPNGEKMLLDSKNNNQYLVWNDFSFGSDSILVTLRYKRNRDLLQKVSETISNYHEFIETTLRKFYTIGGSIIFPKHKNSINQVRGCSTKICDRWDLTLECIRKFYNSEESPLYNALCADKAFFDLFVDFKGYVDFFYLNDCVSADYKKVNIWLNNNDFTVSTLPESVEDYLMLIDKQLSFLQARNERIRRAIQEGNYDFRNKTSHSSPVVRG